MSKKCACHATGITFSLLLFVTVAVLIVVIPRPEDLEHLPTEAPTEATDAAGGGGSGGAGDAGAGGGDAGDGGDSGSSGGAVDGKWGGWADWQECSEPCGGGTQTRSRKCDTPEPSNGGAECVPVDGDSEQQDCNMDAC